MAKVWTYVIITVGLMILFHITGLTENSGLVLGESGINVTNMTSIANFRQIDYFQIIERFINSVMTVEGAVIIGGAALLGIAAQSLSAAVAALVLLAFFSDLITIITVSNETGSWTGWVVGLIMIPLLFGFAIALWEWIMGQD